MDHQPICADYPRNREWPTVGSRPSSRRLGEAQGELARAAPVLQLACSECARRFFLVEDEERRDGESDEMERIGREFLGISEEAVLCPRCLDEVELAGAERTYWRVVHL